MADFWLISRGFPPLQRAAAPASPPASQPASGGADHPNKNTKKKAAKANNKPAADATKPTTPTAASAFQPVNFYDLKFEEVKRDVIVPRSGVRNVLITSALPYVNNVPHLGNIIGCVLSADVYARFCRLRGYNVCYICGTDEYGTATETKALKEGMTPQQICDKYHAIHKKVYQWFGISFDHFGRTSTPVQTKIAQDIFKKCEANGKVTEDVVEQLYCEKDARFLADRFVIGTCPDCRYDDARGDQCDKCGHLLNAVDLVDPKCSICSTQPVVKKSNHLFLNLPALEQELTTFIDTQSAAGKWSANSTSVSKAWLNNGLKPRCITRDLKWGTPVPKPGYEDKVFYVWFDAPIGYISITAAYTPDWERWWKANKPNSEKVELYQFMGKDNIPFHTVIFPSTLLATGKEEGWTMLHHISTTEYLNYEGGKHSKTRGVGVFGDNAAESGIPVEVWRYYLLANRPELSDTDFKWKDFQAKNNDELLKNIGNFVNRALKFLKSEYNGVVPAVVLDESDEKYVAEINSKITEYIECLEDVKIKNALKAAMALSTVGNQYLQHNKPWDLVKDDSTKARASSVAAFAANLVLKVITLLEPFMPSFTDKVLAQLDLPRSILSLERPSFELLIPTGHTIGVPEPLFVRIDDATTQALWKKYGGDKSEEKEVDDSGDSEFPLELRVGKIEKVELHATADHLYILDVSTDASTPPRKIVSGLVKSYKPEELLHRQVVFIANLKAANLKGVKSQGMILCAQKDNKMGLLSLPSGANVVGSGLYPNGDSPKGKFPLLDSKKLKLAMKKVSFSVDASKKVLVGGVPLKVPGQGVEIFTDLVGEGSDVC